MSEAFDYTGRISPADLKAAGVTTVFRYVSTPGNPKNITAAEYKQLTAAGITVNLNYETTAAWMLGGYNAGLAAAKSARQQAAAVGYPAKSRIWYSADFNATSAQVATVLDCLHGCADAEGTPDLVSVYGGLAVVKAAADAGFGMPWQTVAWSWGAWDSRAVIRQTGASRTVGGVTVDVNELTAAPLGVAVLPMQEESDMKLISVTPDPWDTTNPAAGIGLLLSNGVAHVPSQTDITNLLGACGQTSPAVIDTMLYAEIVSLTAQAPIVSLPWTAAQITALGAAIAGALPAPLSAAAVAEATEKAIGTGLTEATITPAAAA